MSDIPQIPAGSDNRRDPVLWDLARRLYGNLLPINGRSLVPPGKVLWTDNDVEALLRLAKEHGSEAEAFAAASRHGLLALRTVIERAGAEQSLPRGDFGDLGRRIQVQAGQDIEAGLLETQTLHLERTRSALEALINIAERAPPKPAKRPWWNGLFR